MYVFLIFGAISFAWGVVFLAFMPDLPSTARFLKGHEVAVAVERVAANRQGVKNHYFKKYQMWQTVKDPKTWILFVMAIAAQIPNAAQSSVSPLPACIPVRVGGNIARDDGATDPILFDSSCPSSSRPLASLRSRRSTCRSPGTWSR
jgi:hypothetical protein